MNEEAIDRYFIILYQRKQKENKEDFIINETNKKNNSIKCIYNKNAEDKGIYYYKKVFQFKGEVKKKAIQNSKKLTSDKKPTIDKKAIIFEFEICEDKYIVTFDIIADKSFVYDVELKTGKIILNSKVLKIIPQNVIKYNEKMDIFIDALKENKEEEKKAKLYKETIELFSKKKGFDFLIPLFVQIYQNRDLCPLLMEKFLIEN